MAKPLIFWVSHPSDLRLYALSPPPQVQTPRYTFHRTIPDPNLNPNSNPILSVIDRFSLNRYPNSNLMPPTCTAPQISDPILMLPCASSPDRWDAISTQQPRMQHMLIRYQMQASKSEPSPSPDLTMTPSPNSLHLQGVMVALTACICRGSW